MDRSTVSKILKKKDDFLNSEGGSGSAVGGGGDDQASTSSSRTSRYPEVEKKLALWAYHSISQGVIVTDQMLQDQAKECAKAIGIGENNFRASIAWVAKFKNRNHLSKGKFTDEGLEMIRQLLNEQQQQPNLSSEDVSRTQHRSNESIYSPLQEAMPNLALSQSTSTNQMPFPSPDSDHTSRHMTHYELSLQQQQQAARSQSYTMAPPVVASSSVATSPTRSQSFPGEFHTASSAAVTSANMSPEMYELKPDHSRLASARKRTSPAQRPPYPSPRERHHLRSQSHHLLGSQLVPREQQAHRLSELDSLHRQMVSDHQQQAALMSSASQQQPMNVSLSRYLPHIPSHLPQCSALLLRVKQLALGTHRRRIVRIHCPPMHHCRLLLGRYELIQGIHHRSLATMILYMRCTLSNLFLILILKVSMEGYESKGLNVCANSNIIGLLSIGRLLGQFSLTKLSSTYVTSNPHALTGSMASQPMPTIPQSSQPPPQQQQHLQLASRVSDWQFARVNRPPYQIIYPHEPHTQDTV